MFCDVLSAKNAKFFPIFPIKYGSSHILSFCPYFAHISAFFCFSHIFSHILPIFTYFAHILQFYSFFPYFDIFAHILTFYPVFHIFTIFLIFRARINFCLFCNICSENFDFFSKIFFQKFEIFFSSTTNSTSKHLIYYSYAIIRRFTLI